jgi:hypothetical protein
MGVLKGAKTAQKTHENKNKSMEIEEGDFPKPSLDGMKNDGPDLPQSTVEKPL